MAIPGTRAGTKIVSLTGDLGSGKSTVASLLADRWGVERYSTGNVQRQIAAEKGLTTLELNQLSETDPSIDQAIDSVFKTLNQSPHDLIIDSRMAWYFVPSSLKVKLTVSPFIAADRVAADTTRQSEVLITRDQIRANLIARKQSEIRRFMNTYAVNVEDDRHYDVVIDTACVTPNDVADLIHRLADLFFSDHGIQRHWISPLALYPREKIIPGLASEAPALPVHEFDNDPVRAIDCQRLYALTDGHARTSKAIMTGLAFIPVQIIEQRPLAQALFDPACIMAWEAQHNFRFSVHPWTVAA